MFDFQEELRKLPDQPGVYIMHDKTDAIIYIGKAVSLRKRVRQYFQPSHDEGIKKKQMVEHIARFEYIITDSELEALVLECNLIKEHTPKYNTMLRDDKTYPYIRVTVQEDFPRVLFSRQVKKDKSRYFGPYTSAGAVKDTIELINKLYKLRTCNRKLPRDIGLERACLNYHIHQCDAPCQGHVDKETYGKQVSKALEFLNGNYGPVIRELKENMQKASGEMEFERAIEYRELLNSVSQIAQKQKITNTDGEDKDIIALASDDRDAVVQVFFIRSGKIIGRDHFHVRVGSEENTGDILVNFVKQYYSGTPFIPREIMLQEAIEDIPVLEEWLTAKRGRKVTIRIPQKGLKEKLVELAARNAQLVLSQDKEKIKREEGRTIGAVKEIEQLLGMKDLNRMEAYDISNINGFETVGSMIVYEKGRPKRSDYRKFKLRTVSGPDDYASMHEVLTRRFTHGMQEQKELENKAESELSGIQLEEANIRQKVEFAQTNVERINGDLEKFETEKTGLLENAKNSKEDVEKKQHDIAEIQKTILASSDSHGELEQKLRESVEQKEQMSAEYRGFFRKQEEISERCNGLDKEVFRLNNQREKLNESAEQQTNYLWEEYELTPHAAAELRNSEYEDPLALKKLIAAVKDEIRKLGTVNVNAIEEYKEVSERYTFLKGQHDDLVEAEQTLLGIIEDLDSGMRKQFMEKFAEIQKEFNASFKHLFGGGHGALELVEDEDILECGIRIIAQPPGKKLQNMMQMSGGEKALTAIALLFAIQALKPSPFCLLDEIEAALDDSNVSRFASYLNKLTKNTQFIVITHRRGTMTAADRLYGITMQEKGVSTLVSVDLIEHDLN